MSITVKKIVESHNIDYHIEVLAGHEGLENTVCWAFGMEEMQEGVLLNNGGLVVSSGAGSKGTDWISTFVHALLRTEASGLLLSVSIDKSEIPDELICLCEEKKFPLLYMPDGVQIFNITKVLCYEILQDERNDTDIGKTFRSMIFYPREAKQHIHVLDENGFDLKNSFLVVILDIRFRDREPENFSSNFKFRSERLLRSLKVNYGHFESDTGKGYLQVFIMNGLERERAIEIIELLQKHMDQYQGIEAVIGAGPFQGSIHDISRSYKRTVFVTKLGRARKTSPICFDEAGLYKVLMSVDDISVLNDYYQEVLGELALYDKNSGTNYIELLKVYLESDASVQETAARLFVHRNTINYQLNRIKAITGMDLSSLEDRFRLMVALRVQDLL